MGLPVLAEVVRSGFVEGRHVGSVVALDAAGRQLLTLGRPEDPVFPRSCAKPVQAAAMLHEGLALDGELLAVAAASHAGEPYHLDLVRRLLAAVDARADMLGNTPGWPLDEQAALEAVRSGGEPSALAQNCSGKHAAMVGTCLHAGWPVESYLAADHPLQRAVRRSLERLAGEPVAATGVDGCGAPLYAVSLAGIARCFQRLVRAEPGSPERRVADAMRRHPRAVGGRARLATRLMANVPGLLAKDGAEGVFAAATADGTALAIKIDDGAERAVAPVVAEVLRVLGVRDSILGEVALVPVRGGGRMVGTVRAVGVHE